MDPLSITASVTGILTAAAKVISVLGTVKDAPDLISKVLIELDDIVVILTQIVLTFSELEEFIRPLSDDGKVSRWQRVTWTWEQSRASKLVNQLQHHKTSLSLMLQIMQCESFLEAEESSVSLREHIGQEVEDSPDLLGRLQGLEVPLGGIDPEEKSSTPRAEISGESDLLDRDHTATHASGLSQMEEIDFPRASFDITLSATRVYDRVKYRDVDEISTVLTDRSHAWSLLSSLSLSQLSSVAVINLPLYDSELRSFWKLATPDKGVKISYPQGGSRAIDSKPDIKPFLTEINRNRKNPQIGVLRSHRIPPAKKGNQKDKKNSHRVLGSDDTIDL